MTVGEKNVSVSFALRGALSAKKCPKLMSWHMKSSKSVTDFFFLKIPTVKVFQNRGDVLFWNSKNFDHRKF